MYRQPPTHPSTELAPPRQAPRKRSLLSAIARILAASRAQRAASPPRAPNIEWALRMMD